MKYAARRDIKGDPAFAKLCGKVFSLNSIGSFKGIVCIHLACNNLTRYLGKLLISNKSLDIVSIGT